MPISTAPYKRTYKHTKSRGRETTIACGICGRLVPRYKTFVLTKGFKVTDPSLLQQVDRRFVSMLTRKIRVCPACARFQGIVQPGKSVRKKLRRIR
jgi:ribosomal protein S26